MEHRHRSLMSPNYFNIANQDIVKNGVVSSVLPMLHYLHHPMPTWTKHQPSIRYWVYRLAHESTCRNISRNISSEMPHPLSGRASWGQYPVPAKHGGVLWVSSSISKCLRGAKQRPVVFNICWHRPAQEHRQHLPPAVDQSPLHLPSNKCLMAPNKTFGPWYNRILQFLSWEALVWIVASTSAVVWMWKVRWYLHLSHATRLYIGWSGFASLCP